MIDINWPVVGWLLTIGCSFWLGRSSVTDAKFLSERAAYWRRSYEALVKQSGQDLQGPPA